MTEHASEHAAAFRSVDRLFVFDQTPAVPLKNAPVVIAQVGCSVGEGVGAADGSDNGLVVS